MALHFAQGGALESLLVAQMLDGPGDGLPGGAVLGPYRILEEIGRGGTGVVYAAERIDGAFEQRVALKVVRAYGAAPDRQALIARERRLLARLEHPGIARLLDGGSADGRVWFATERIAGLPIDRYCARHGLRAAARLRLLREVCDAVAYAHARLVVHRDIKPSNILVDANGHVRLLDFGIAGALDGCENDDAVRGASTPRFASPEQLAGATPAVPSDIYQLGLLIRRVMAGVAGSDRQGLAAVVARATSRDASARYASADALSAELGALLAGRSVKALSARAAYRLRRLVARHAWRIAAAAVVAAAFAGLAVLHAKHLDRARRLAEREAVVARSMAEFMVDLFGGSDPQQRHGRPFDLGELLGSARRRLDVIADPALHGMLAAALGRVHLAVDDRGNALQLLRQSVALGAADPVLSSVDLGRRHRWFARALMFAHRLDEAAVELERARVLVADEAAGAAAFVEVLQDIALLRYQRGEGNAALDGMREGAAIAAASLGEDAPESLAIRFNLGHQLYVAGVYDEAESVLSRLHRAIAARYGDLHPTGASAAAVLAMTTAKLGRQEDARQWAAMALSATAATFGERSPRMVLALRLQGAVAIAREDFATALEWLGKALALNDALPPADDIDSVGILERLGDAHLAMDDVAAAEAAYREMLKRNAGGGRALDPDQGQRPLKLARTLDRRGRCAEARELFDAARRSAGAQAPADLRDALAKPLDRCAAETHVGHPPPR